MQCERAASAGLGGTETWPMLSSHPRLTLSQILAPLPPPQPNPTQPNPTQPEPGPPSRARQALVYLTRRLKPLESMQATPDEFRDLCYLLTCRAVHEAPSFKNWEGVTAARSVWIKSVPATARLAAYRQRMVTFVFVAIGASPGPQREAARGL